MEMKRLLYNVQQAFQVANTALTLDQLASGLNWPEPSVARKHQSRKLVMHSDQIFQLRFTNSFP